jgi:hypothetical protein
MPLPENKMRAIKYISAIRNPPKQSYAWMWFTHCTQGIADRLPSSYSGLSYMAAQAVRIKLAEFGITEQSGLNKDDKISGPVRYICQNHIVE